MGEMALLGALGIVRSQRYTIIKNWNDHGEVRGWIYGPYENDFLFEVLHSPYMKDTTHFFRIYTLTTEDHDAIYPSFEEYGIIPSYKDYKTSEGSIHSGGYGGYYLDEIDIEFSDGVRKICPPGLHIMIFYDEDGLLLESADGWIDDFLDQKLGIVLLDLGFLYLTDCGIKNRTMIEPPTPETQRTSFKKEVEMMVGSAEENVSTETPSETQITETPQKSEQKSETPLPTEQSQEKMEILYYIVPILIVVIIAVFLVVKERR